jgi:hypothetical protein
MFQSVWKTVKVGYDNSVLRFDVNGSQFFINFFEEIYVFYQILSDWENKKSSGFLLFL